MPDCGPLVYSFEGYELDPARFELRADGHAVRVEPQVLSLLILLAENSDRMIGKDELIDAIWDGRIVSESAVSARIKEARKAIGDDGKSQRLIRTIHGKGFRFVGAVQVGRVQAEPRPADTIRPSLTTEVAAGETIVSALRTAREGRPSVAVLPFQLLGEPGPHDIVADALPADILIDLSRLHWLFVIARGSSFRFRGDNADPLAVGRELAVRYCLTGSIELAGDAVSVSASLVDTLHGETIWAEHYRGSLNELQQMRPDIVSHVVAALEVHIPRNEVQLARGRPVAELDAWASFHLGLDHMYRFTRDDNAQAARLFEHALLRDPWFSRAMGGLSFTHFQKAFLRIGEDRVADMEAARELAHRAIEADRLDPFAHFNAGRSSWLEGRLEDSLAWFDRATSLSPSYAQGLYNRGLVGIMAGRAEAADADLALAIELSPLDPLGYAMVSSRALTHLQFGDLEAAARFGSRAAAMPGAHKHIALIAGATAHLAGKAEEAREWVAAARKADPDLDAETFFRTFPFAETTARETLSRAFAQLGV